ncbi:PEP-CTERM sorting domain-containing protein [Rubritalea tangerina]|uniref:PEP-CTERM sorting domain-containing protein n=1 Tax=Rubritalea tangerina TaxID=430798 RepID=A0ABW4ZEV7_9BACT
MIDRTSTLATLVTLSLLSASQAATTLFSINAEGRYGPNLTNASSNVTSITSSGLGTQTLTITHTLSENDYDGDLVNDTLEVTFTAIVDRPTGNTTGVIRQNGHKLGVDLSGASNNTINAADEKIDILITGATLTLTGAAMGSSGSVTDFDITGFTMGDFNDASELYILNGTPGQNANDVNFGTEVSGFDIEFDTNSSAGYRLRTVKYNVDISVTAIPEPSSAALLLIGAPLCLMRRMRKS